MPEAFLALNAQWSSLSVRRILEDHRVRLMTLADELTEGVEVETHVAIGSVYDGILQLPSKPVPT